MDSTLTNGSFNFFSGLTTIEIPERNVNFAHVECLTIGPKLKVDTNMTSHTSLESWTCPQYDVLI